MKKGQLLLFALSLIITGGCIRNPATRKVHTRLLSPEAERKIGEESKKEILKEYRVLNSTAVTAYVNALGQKIAKTCDRPTVDYDFTVIDNDVVNAFALPGGFIFVTRGLMESMDEEDELAMVIGHEIGHVAALHGVQMIQKEMGQNALTILGTIGTAVVAGPEAMILVANTANLFSSLYMLGYSREKELEADNLGLQYMLRAGYDPKAALRFFKKLQAGETEKAKGWDLYFRTHPSTEERISIIESMVGRDDTSNQTPAQKKVYQDIKAQLPKVLMSERGEINGNTYANGYHELTFSVLPNWTLGFFRPQALVAFQTLDRNAEGRLQVVRLGTTTINAEQLALRFAQDQGFQLITGHEVLYPAGYGYLGRYFGASPGGAGQEIRLFTTIRRNRGYVFFCGAPIEKPEIYILDIERIMRSLKFS